MPFFNPRSVFLAIPKTGSSWVNAAMRAAGLPVEQRGDQHGTHGPEPGRLIFTFVRHPVPYLQSRHQLGGFTDSLGPIWLQNFQGWIEKILEQPAGFLGRRFEEYTSRAGFVGRTETLADDLVKALRLAGEDFDEEALRATKRQHISIQVPEYGPGQAARLVIKEHKLITAMYPEGRP